MSIAPANILQYLRALDGITPPLWLTGGVAVDFLVGRWTRLHKDLDLIALSPARAALQTELGARGFSLAQEGRGPRVGLLPSPTRISRSCSWNRQNSGPACW